MKKFTIKAINTGYIILTAEDGQELQIGYKKNAIKFFELRTKQVGDAVMLNTATSDQGRLYLAENDEFRMSELKVYEYQLKMKQIQVASAALI
jgi:hypothetical protein